jgi:pilus assembly protein FimV
VKQYTENQYDDDLTVGTDDYDYDDSYQTEAVDLFEFSTDEESPISQLKSLILSIDWEITDEVLMEFSDELMELRTLWAGEKLNLVYIQALEKISKYIYHKKADSHPNAIKLLLTLYYNLEKIVSSVDLSDEEKKKILLEDVKRFENLKREIRQTSYDVDAPDSTAGLGQLQEPAGPAGPAGRDVAAEDDIVEGDSGDLLLNLRAIVLGIDWEITDEELNNLRQEVVRLEEEFSGERPKLILLQGIGTLGAYIKLKKSDAHADAFKVLHNFYDCLEQLVQTPMSLDEEKKILFPAVERFNAFKALVGSTITERPAAADDDLDEEDDYPAASGTITPAFADMSDEDIHGFQADEEARALGLDESGNLGSQVDSFFAEDDDTSQVVEDDTMRLEEVGGAIDSVLGIESEGDTVPVAKEFALRGIDVEEEDDEEDELSAKHYDDITPALSGALEGVDGPASLSSLDLDSDKQESCKKIGADSTTSPAEDVVTDIRLDRDIEVAPAEIGFAHLDKETALQGVEVETEADDDSDEESLPTKGGALAPALAENEETSVYSADDLEKMRQDAGIEEEILQNIDGLFGEKTADVAADSDIEVPAAAETDSHLDSFFGVGETGAEKEENLCEPPSDISEEIPETAGLAPAEHVELPAKEGVVFELVEDVGVAGLMAGGPFSQETAEMLQNLRGNVKSIENQFDSEALKTVLQQLAALRQDFGDKPLEQTFVQLLLAVVQHIDRYRHSTAEHTYRVLYEVCDALEQAQHDSMYGRQERLLRVTTSVLEWQQDHLAQQATGS